jgi:hypothetical protein
MFFIGNGNHILDLEHDHTLAKVPGRYDPVPVPPAPGKSTTRFFTVPVPYMQFFDLEASTSKMIPGQTLNLKDAKPVFSDSRSNYSYQSVGVLGKALRGPTRYRVASGSLEIRNYRLSSDGKWKTTGENVGHCPSAQAGRYLSLPMISKDGKMAAAFDSSTGTTKIFDLKDNGECSLALELGFATGKVEFSYQNDKITFHVDSYNSDLDGHQFSGIDHNMSKNIYTLDLARGRDGKLRTGAMQRVTANTKAGEGSYYPSFTMDGRIVYIHGARDIDSGRVRFSFRRVDPRKSPLSPSALEIGGTCPADTAAHFALGDLFKSVCKKLLGDGLAATDAALWTLSLDPVACRKLVMNHWSDLVAQIKANEQLLRPNRFQQAHLDALTQESVLAACPKASAHTAPEQWHPDMHESFVGGGSADTDPRSIFDHRCKSCHDGGQSAKFDWNNLSLQELNRMLIAIQQRSMPQGNFENREAMMQPLVEELLRRREAMEEMKANEIE